MTPSNILKHISCNKDNPVISLISHSLQATGCTGTSKCQASLAYLLPFQAAEKLTVCLLLPRQGDSLSSIENAVKYNPMYESDTTGYSHYYRRYPQLTSYSSTSAETSTDYSSEEIRHIYENSELTKEVNVLVFTVAWERSWKQ